MNRGIETSTGISAVARIFALFIFICSVSINRNSFGQAIITTRESRHSRHRLGRLKVLQHSAAEIDITTASTTATQMSSFSGSQGPSASPASSAEPSSKVEVYSTIGCKYCRLAKAKLGEYSVTYVNYDINEPDQPLPTEKLQMERKIFAKGRTVPQIYVGDQHIGGCDDLLAAIANGSFTQLLDDYGVGYSLPLLTDLSTAVGGAADKTKTNNNSSSDVNSNSGAGGSVCSSSAVDFAATPKFTGKWLNSAPASTTSTPAFASASNTAAEASGTETTSGEPFLAVKLSKALQREALILTDQFVTPDGSKVDYQSMRGSRELLQFTQLASTLETCSSSISGSGSGSSNSGSPPLTLDELSSSLSDTQKIAFFSNLYNAMVIHATCVIGAPADSPAARAEFFSGASGAKYNLCGHLFSLDDVEHGVLRANRPHPSQPPTATSYLSVEDPRAVLAVSPEAFDPRIHFILNCGAASCPPIRILDAGAEDEKTKGNLEEALTKAAAAYLEKEVFVQKLPLPPRAGDGSSPSSSQSQQRLTVLVKLPKLLMWYGKDFLPLQTRGKQEQQQQEEEEEQPLSQEEHNRLLMTAVARMLPEGNANKEELRKLLMLSDETSSRAAAAAAAAAVSSTTLAAAEKEYEGEKDGEKVPSMFVDFQIEFNAYDWTGNEKKT